MKRAFGVLLAVLPLTAQPKLLVNAQVDTRAAAGGLDREFRSLLSAQPQPAWIGYSVPSVRSYNLGCEHVSPGGFTVPGVVHLEPPDHAIILMRVEGGAVSRVRALSPDCEIDAGGVPLHWLTDVQPAQSVALLAMLDMNDSVMAIAMHADSSADDELRRLAMQSSPRRNAAYWLGAARGKRGIDILKDLLAASVTPTIRERAMAGLEASRDPAALDLLIQLARTDGDSKIRRRAVSAIGRSRDPRAQAFLEDVLKR